MEMVRRLMLAVATVTVALVGLATMTLPASAHDQVIQTTPASGETVSTGTIDIEILTSGELLDLGGNSSGFAITVTDQLGLFYGDGCVVVEGPALSTVAALGDSGEYVVTYQYVSGDGHTLSGQYSFRFERPDDYLPAAGQAEAPVCGEEPVYPLESTTEVAQDPEPEVQEEPTVATVDDQSDQWLTRSVIAAVAIVLLGTMSYLFVIRQRSQRLD